MFKLGYIWAAAYCLVFGLTGPRWWLLACAGVCALAAVRTSLCIHRVPGRALAIHIRRHPR
jgi:hypothetical protein